MLGLGSCLLLVPQLVRVRVLVLVYRPLVELRFESLVLPLSVVPLLSTEISLLSFDMHSFLWRKGKPALILRTIDLLTLPPEFLASLLLLRVLNNHLDLLLGFAFSRTLIRKQILLRHEFISSLLGGGSCVGNVGSSSVFFLKDFPHLFFHFLDR